MVAVLLDYERRCNPYEEKAMFSRVKSSRPSSSKNSSGPSKCTYCKKTDHTANHCFKRLDDLDAADKANLVEVHSDKEADPPSEQAHSVMAHLSIDDEYDPDS